MPDKDVNYRDREQMRVRGNRRGTGIAAAMVVSLGLAITAAPAFAAPNAAPVVNVPGTQAMNEQATLTLSAGTGNGVSVVDPDSDPDQIKVVLDADDGLLTLADPSGLEFEAGDGIADETVTFRGTNAEIAAALNGMTFAAAGDDPDNFAAIQIAADDEGNNGDDGAKTGDGVVQITVNPQNDDPVNTVPGAQTTNEDTAKVFSAASSNAISVADADAGSDDIRIGLGASNGTITLPTTTGLNLTQGDGTSDTAIIAEGTTAEWNAALNGLSFSPAGNFNGVAGLAMDTDDLGQSGSGGTKADSDSVAITVSAVNDNPVNSVPGTQTTAEDTPKVLSTANGNAISVADVDAGGANIRVTVDARVDNAPHGSVTLAGVAGLTFTSGDGNDDPTTTFEGTIANINAALDGLSYTPKKDVSGTDAGRLIVNTSDLGNSGSGGTKTDNGDAVNFDVTPVDDDPPTPSIPDGLGTYKNLDKALRLADLNQIKVVDPDSPPASTEVRVALTSTHGTMSLATTSGLTITSGANGSAAMTLEGEQSAVNGALDTGLTFAPESGFTGQATIDVTSIDLTDMRDASDAGTIEIDQPEEAIYWTAAKETVGSIPGGLGRAELDGGGGANLNTGPELNDTPGGVAIDAVEGTIYWANTAAIDPDDKGIWRANLDGTGEELFLTAAQALAAGSHLDSAFNMAIDQETRRLYWANSDNATAADRGISYISLDNTTVGGRVSTGSANVTSPRGLALDLENDRVYWSNWTMTQGISYAPLPGATGTAGNFTIGGSGVNQASGVALDLESEPNRIFWANSSGTPGVDEAQRLRFADLADPFSASITGSAFNISPNAGGGIRTPAIDFDADRIYWANSSGDKITHANLDGTGGAADLAIGGAYSNSLDGATILKKPAPIDPPPVTGTPTAGQTLTCGDAEWAADAPNAALYRMPASESVEWTRNGATISGANGSTLTPDSAGAYRCVAKASNFAGTSSQQSSAVSVSAVPDPPPDDTPPGDETPPADDTPPADQDPPVTAPDNDIEIGGAKVEKKNGTAKLSVEVPGAGHLKLHGKDVKTVEHEADGAGTESLKITATGKAKKKLKVNGKAKVTVDVTFTPNGGQPNTETKQVTLKAK